MIRVSDSCLKYYRIFRTNCQALIKAEPGASTALVLLFEAPCKSLCCLPKSPILHSSTESTKSGGVAHSESNIEGLGVSCPPDEQSPNGVYAFLRTGSGYRPCCMRGAQNCIRRKACPAMLSSVCIHPLSRFVGCTSVGFPVKLLWGGSI